MDLASVIIPTRNRAGLLMRAIESVLAQDYRPLEIVVIDDGSTDSTREDVARIPANSIKYHYNMGPRHGEDIARNLGVSLAKGDYIAWLDDDDEYLPGKLAAQKAYLDEVPEAEVVFCRIREFLPDSSQSLDPAVMNAISFAKSRVWHASMMARSELYKKVGLYNNISVDGRCDQDWLYRAHFLHGVNLDHCVDRELIARHLHEGNFSYKMRNSGRLKEPAKIVDSYIRQKIRQRLAKDPDAG